MDDDLYLQLHAPPPPGRPHVAVNMVMAVDGTIALDGSSRQLGGPADKLAFRRLRERADVILAGAGTVRAEGYGPPRVSERGRRRREQRGQASRPRLAVITRSGDLDPRARMFSAATRPPLVITGEAVDTGHLDAVAEIVRAGPDSVDLPAALRALRERGVEWLLVEGGPSLNGELAAAGLIDELFVTIHPVLAGGRTGLLEGGLAAAPQGLALTELHRRGDEVLLRYRLASDDQ